MTRSTKRWTYRMKGVQPNRRWSSDPPPPRGTVVFEVDWDALAAQMGGDAYRTKTKRTRLAGGLITVRFIQDKP